MLWQYQWKNISWESLYEPAKIILGISGHLQSFIRLIKIVENFEVIEFDIGRPNLELKSGYGKEISKND